MGHRGEPNLTIISIRISHLHDGFTDLARFWEIDEGPPTAHISEAERQCEGHFRNHVQRTNEGRYVVTLPFNGTTPSLGSSKAMAMKRLTSLCCRFQRDKRFEADYHAVIQEYLELDIKN